MIGNKVCLKIYNVVTEAHYYSVRPVHNMKGKAYDKNKDFNVFIYFYYIKNILRICFIELSHSKLYLIE